MDKTFYNRQSSISFSDEGITLIAHEYENLETKEKLILTKRFLPYGCIEKVTKEFGRCFRIIIKGGIRRGFTYDKTMKPYVKELIEYTMQRIKEAPPAEMSERTIIQTEQPADIPLDKEYRMRCGVCGNIFCYTKGDLLNNEINRKNANIDSVVGAMTGLFVSQYQGFEYKKRAENTRNKIVNYSKCPKCGSSELVEIGENETINSSEKSNVDELKNFKELLDGGIITQEEFDAKKKQLLGL